jgi:urease accessory protein
MSAAGGPNGLDTQGLDAGSLLRLTAWLSPTYPVGAYSFSHGLEAAGEAGLLETPAALQAWLERLLLDGAGVSDGAFLAHAHAAAGEADDDALQAVHELALAFQPSAELALESQAQGRAFLRQTRAAWPCADLDRLAGMTGGHVAYPVAVGAAAAGHGVPLDATLTAYLGAFAGNLVSAALRILPIGQNAGQTVLAELTPSIEAAARAARVTALEDVATAVPHAEILSIAHETQYTRLFRS